MGAVARGLWAPLRFPSPLIEPDVSISGIRVVLDAHPAAKGRLTRYFPKLAM
jgi:hypothetical protein